MPVQMDFTISRYSDATIVVQLDPPQPIGGWAILWEVARNFGGGGFLGSSGLVTKWANSGFCHGESGIAVTNSGAGIFNINLNSVDTSGWDFGNYAQSASRVQSGARLPLVQGYLRVLPSVDG